MRLDFRRSATSSNDVGPTSWRRRDLGGRDSQSSDGLEPSTTSLTMQRWSQLVATVSYGSQVAEPLSGRRRLRSVAVGCIRCFVRVDDDLGAVAEVEFPQDARDVALHGGIAEVELCCDLAA